MKEQLQQVLNFLHELRAESLFHLHDKRKEAMTVVTNAMNEIELLQKKQETIADIAYMAGTHHYYSGDSRADMQTFIHLADKFEEEHKGVDWNSEAKEDDDAPDYITSVEEFFNENLRIVDKLAFDYPNGTRYEWDNVEIAGCKDDGESTYRVDDDSETPDFFTVYLHLTEGGTMAVADLPTEKLAQDCAEMLHNAVISFKDNGFLPLSRNAELHRKFNLLLDERINMASSVQTKAAYEIVKDQFNSLIKP